MVEVGDLSGGAQFVRQIDHQGLLVAGHPAGEGPHVGDDDVLLHRAQAFFSAATGWAKH